MVAKEKDGLHRVRSDEAIIMWPDLYKVDREERRRQQAESVDRIFSDYLMIGLSLILLPIILVPFFVNIPTPVQESLDVIDYGIVFIFIFEYVLKLAMATDRKAFVKSPWHLLDLFIIAASLAGPLANAITGSSYNKTSIAVVLRLIRIPAAISLGGRSVKRREEAEAERKREAEKEKDPLARFVDLETDEAVEWEVADFPPNVEGGGKLTHVSNISPKHLADLGSMSGVPKVLLDGKTRDIAYPRAENLSGVPSVFMRVPEVFHDEQQVRFWFVEWKGILFLDTKTHLLSISRHDIPSVLEVPADAQKEEPCTLLKHAAFTTAPGKPASFTATGDGGFVLFVQSLLPVNLQKKNTELPQFTQQVRRGRSNEAFNRWLQAEANRELSNTPVYAELMGGKNRQP